jgi:hypothetical protein
MAPRAYQISNLPFLAEELWVKGTSGEFVKIDAPSGGEVTVAWDDVTGKPTFGALATQDSVAYADVTGKPTLGTLAALNTITTTNITDGTITNADINAAAAIALSKIANVAAGTGGLVAGTLQATFQALATRIQALEDAP